MQLNGKRVMLTGASGGIGEAMVSALAEKGAHLVITGRNQQKLMQIASAVKAAGGVCEVVVADLGTSEGIFDVQQVVHKLGYIDLLINNAGISEFEAFDIQSDDVVDRLMHINLISPMKLTKRLLPYLEASGRGLVVNIGSAFGSIGYPGFASYCASKFGLRGFSEALSRELADTNIDVCYIAPRATKTAINSQQVMDMNDALGVRADSADWVAQQVVKTVQKNRRSVYLGWPEKLFVRVNALFPSVVAHSIIKQLPIIRRFLASAPNVEFKNTRHIAD